MSEYIVNVPDEEAEYFIARFGFENVKLMGYGLTGEIVRCRDCEYQGKPHKCWLGETKPDEFCSRGKRKESGDD